MNFSLKSNIFSNNSSHDNDQYEYIPIKAGDAIEIITSVKISLYLWYYEWGILWLAYTVVNLRYRTELYGRILNFITCQIRYGYKSCEGTFSDMERGDSLGVGGLYVFRYPVALKFVLFIRFFFNVVLFIYFFKLIIRLAKLHGLSVMRHVHNSILL